MLHRKKRIQTLFRGDSSKRTHREIVILSIMSCQLLFAIIQVKESSLQDRNIHCPYGENALLSIVARRIRKNPLVCNPIFAKMFLKERFIRCVRAGKTIDKLWAVVCLNFLNSKQKPPRQVLKKNIEEVFLGVGNDRQTCLMSCVILIIMIGSPLTFLDKYIRRALDAFERYWVSQIFVNPWLAESVKEMWL